jgi:MFS family permease
VHGVTGQTTIRPGTTAPGWRSDFRRLWSAYAVSALGSALGLGALPLIALVVLHASELEVSLLAALSGIASAALALPMGPWVEFRRKRPVMIGADLVRCLALLSVPVAAAAGRLSYLQLCLVAVVQTTGTMVYTAASGAHLRGLVPAAHRTTANSRLETTFWATVSTGPAVGGLLVAWLGATATVVLDAVSFLLSAVGVRRLRTPEPPPPVRTAAEPPLARVTAGWRYIHGHPGLRTLFVNTSVFGGGVMAVSPLATVLMLRDLGFTPWQYGMALGLPGVGGVLGSLAAPRLVARYGQRTALLLAGVGRVPWLALLPLARPGLGGLLLVIAGETLLRGFAGVFNPVFATYRMEAAGDSHLARVGTTWSIGSKVVQPLCVTVGGLLAAATGPRTAIAVFAVVTAASVLWLPWRRTDGPVGGSPGGDAQPS